ncbi:Hint domain-containing protein [Acetobacter senegalensis]|uniref:Hint domain-containing protein n=1 Tax=Acetobacter senegalensis TaxID=446692 RepID=UPI002652A71A|nr:Hint domain-containing protein [Acetobacter senegalensis]MDN7351446.1 Hint domain-containing protein [Acetobacter senegalensis]
MAIWIGTSNTVNKSWSNSANWTDLGGGNSGVPTTWEGITVNNDAVVDLPASYSSSGTLTVNGKATFNSADSGSSLSFGSASFASGSALTLNGVSATFGGGAKGTGTITLENGASLKSSNGSEIASTVIFKQNTDATGAVLGNTLTIDFNGGTANQIPSIQNLSTYDKIVIAGTGSTAVTLGLTANGDGTYSLTGAIPSWGNKTFVISSSVTLAGNLTPSDFTVTTDSANTTLVCFLPGSMIRTPTGDVAVEDIRVGDEVVAYINGKAVVRPVIWAGCKGATVRAHLPDDEAGYPVRVKQDAIAEGVPYKDMLITPDHCLFFDGRFVPVRMLVNGTSIFYDRSILSYDYYHIETDEHSVILADGMLTESYLDTGNRMSFQQEGIVARLGSRTLNWAEHAAAPLEVSRAWVEPLFHALAARAGLTSADAPAVVHDADLHLLTNTGTVVRPLRAQNGRSVFLLPPGTHAVRLLSRTSRPADAIGPFVDDRRQLGVLIGEITLLNGQNRHSVREHLTVSDLSGWHGLESERMRWTGGNADLPLPELAENGSTWNGLTLLILETVAAGPYLVDRAEHGEAARCA